MPASALDPEQVVSSEDGRISPAGLLSIKELPTEDPDAILDSPLDDNYKLSRSALIEPDQVSITELSPADP